MHVRSILPLLLAVACVDPVDDTEMTITTAPKLVRHADAIDGQYIVVLRASRRDLRGTVDELAARHGATVDRRYAAALHGFAATMTPADAELLADDPDVLYVEEDTPVHASATQSNPDYGLDRLDQASLPLDAKYTFTSDGAGTTVFVIDTGINTTHTELTGRIRADLGATAIDDGNGVEDCNGHGTHVSGTIAGTTYGVAKGATIVPIRVLDCDGSGSKSGVIAGIDYVAQHHPARSVVNMSLGGSADAAEDMAIQSLVASGVTVVVAAGNETQDACNASPAREPLAITVASTTSSDARSSFSNFGTCVDIFAPGSNIKSAWIGSTTATNTISGTSMASPHVAGAAALFLAQNPNATPAQVAAGLMASAATNKVTDIQGSPNRLLQTNFTTAPPPPPPGGNVKITSPADGAEVQANFNVTVDAASATKVDLVVDGSPLVTDTMTPFAFSISNAPAGMHQVSVTATDSAGQTATQTITVTVVSFGGGLGNGNNPVPPPTKMHDGGGCSAAPPGGGLWLVFVIGAIALARRHRALHGSVLVVLLPMFDRQAFAQYVPVDFTQQTFAAMNISTSYQLSMATLGSRHANEQAPVPTIAKGNANVPKTLAASYPPSQRAAAEHALTKLLAAYPTVEAKLGAPRGDVGAAVAFFVVACYEAYHDTTIDPGSYDAIVAQIRPLVAHAAPKDRRALYEQMAILGMLVSMARLDLAKHPEDAKAAALHKASSTYLGAFGIDPEALRIGSLGFARD